MNCVWSVPIEKLMIWRTNNWMKYELESQRLILRVNYDQLLIVTSDSKILESLNLNRKLKGIYKEDILIMYVSLSGKEIRKIKFKITANVAQCLQKLGEHFPVTSYNGSKTCINSKYRDIDEVIKIAIARLKNSDAIAASDTLPSDYSNFVSLCLLDPAFPKVVKETEQFLKEYARK